MTGLNPGQRRVAAAVGEDLFVTAGAGAGKTRALTSLFVAALTEGDGRAGSARDALAITFTEKAAAELALRVRRLLKEDGHARTARAVASLWISTIHGLCSRLLRRHALEAGLPPHFSVLDEMGATLLRREVMDEVAREMIARDPGVERLFFDYGVERVRRSLLGVHSHARTLGIALDAMRLDGEGASGPEIGVHASRVEEVVGAYRSCGDDGKRALQNLERATTLLERIGSSGSLDPEEVLAWCEEARPRYRTKASADAFELHDEVVAGLGREASDALVGRHAASAMGVLARFEERYTAAKRRRAVLDFEDLQLRTRDLLAARSDIAARYRSRFRSVLVDEFQDTDPLQTEILGLLAPEGLCTVGDERQSIYGFRHADVELFRSRRQDLDPGRVVELNENYRSHPAVLDAVDPLFRSPAFFGDSSLPLLHARDESLHGSPEMGRARVVLVDEGSSGADARAIEASVLAARIAEALEKGVPPRDVAVLLRDRTRLDTYVGALRSRGIPLRVEAGETLFARPEVDLMRELLRVVVNPLDEEALVTVLAGPLAQVGADGLMRLNAAATDSLWDAMIDPSLPGLREEDARAVRTFVNRLGTLRALMMRGAPGDVVREASILFPFGTGIADVRPDGIATAAVVDASLARLARTADEYTEAEAGSLADVLEHLHRLEHQGVRIPVHVVAGPSDAVRVMTIHAAKGLEFPLVAVAGLGGPPRKDRPAIALDPWGEEPRLVLRTPGRSEKGGEARPSEAYDRFAERADERALEEEKRILYVACTRAEEALLVSGTAPLTRAPDGTGLADRLRVGLGLGALPHPDEDEPGAPGSPTRLRAGGFEVECHWGVPTEEAPRHEGSARTEPDEGETPESPPSIPERALSSPTITPAVRDAAAGSLDRLSYSALRTHGRCAYKAYVASVVGSANAGDAWSESRAFGDAAHELLALTTAGTLPDDGVIRAVAGRYRLEAAKGLEAVTALREVLERFAGSEYARRAAAADADRREERFMVDLDGVLLVGDMDLYATKDRSVLILDHKTGERVGDRAGHALQARCYALAALEAGAERVEVVFAFWRATSERTSDLRSEFVREDGDHIRSDLSRRAREMRDGPWPPLQSYDPSACSDCPAAGGWCPVSVPRSASAR